MNRGKILRRAFIAFLTVIFALSAAIVGASVKFFDGYGECELGEFTTIPKAKERALERAKSDAQKQAGLYLKSESRSLNSELVDDAISAVTNNIIDISGVEYETITQKITERTTAVVIVAKIKASIDPEGIYDFIKRDDKEKVTIIQQNDSLQEAIQKNDKEFEDLKEQYKQSDTQDEKNRILEQMKQVDRDFLANQKLEEALKFYYAKNYQESIKLNTEALQLKPNWDWAYNNRGTAYAALGQNERAIQDLDKAIELNPNNDYAYNNRGNAYKGLGQYERAIQDYDKAIALNPNDAVAYYNRGNAYYYLGQKERAIQDFDKAIQLNTNYDMAYNNRGVAYNDLGEYERAIQDFNKTIELNPNLSEAYNNRGFSYAELGQKERAIQDFNIAIELNPNLAEAYHNRGLAYAKMEQYELAIQDYDKALQFMEHPFIYAGRGEAHYFSKNYKQAFDDLNKSIELGLEGKNLGEVLYYRGLCYQATGNNAKAQADFAKAKELGYNG